MLPSWSRLLMLLLMMNLDVDDVGDLNDNFSGQTLLVLMILVLILMMVPVPPRWPGIDDLLSMVALFHLLYLEFLCSVPVTEQCAWLAAVMVSTGSLD